MKKYLLATLLILSGFGLAAESADDVLGFWFNEKKDAKFEIYKCGEKYCAKIFWLKEPNYTATSGAVKDGKAKVGEPKVDTENPDESQRKNPIVGMQFLKGFDFEGGNKWSNGKIYDPESGKLYKSTMTLKTKDLIDVRGYVGWGVASIGKTSAWYRTTK